ncbi:MAG: DUF1643 domain-containing protein [Hyphomonadaceae bacterium]
MERERVFTGIVVTAVMLNPSTANDVKDDATVTRLLTVAAEMKARRLVIVNLFAVRTAYPRELRIASDPIGVENDQYVLSALNECDRLIFAWGASRNFPRSFACRWREVSNWAAKLGKEPSCFGVCKDGHPRHPSRMPRNTVPQAWTEVQCLSRRTLD